MSDVWNRASFRPGQAANYDELNNQEEQAGEGRRSGGNHGRGDAGMGGAPAPVPGDDLYAALVFAREQAAEKDHRAAIVAERDDGFSLLAWATGAELAAGNDQPERDNERGSFQSLTAEQAEVPVQSQAQTNVPGQWRGAADEVTLPNSLPPRPSVDIPPPPPPPGDGPDGPIRPGARAAADGLMRDFVSADTLAEARDEWAQRARRRDRSAGLTM